MDQIVLAQPTYAIAPQYGVYTGSHYLVPDLGCIDRATLSDNTRRQYKRAIDLLVANQVDILDAVSLAEYSQTLPMSGRRFLKAAVSIIADDLQMRMDNSLGDDVSRLPYAQLWERRMAQIKRAVSVKAVAGQRLHMWLGAEQVRALFATCDTDTLEGMRDWVVMALAFAAGMRREECSRAKWTDLTVRGNRTVIEITGKGNKLRSVPLSKDVVAYLAKWRAMVGGEYICRSLIKGGKVGNSISASTIVRIFDKRGAMIGLEGLNPHDGRRSFAELGYRNGVSLPEVSQLLGHSSIETTRLYLDLRINLDVSISDFVPVC